MLDVSRIEPASLEARTDDTIKVQTALDRIAQRICDDVCAAIEEMGLSLSVQPNSSEILKFADWRETLPVNCAVALGQTASYKGPFFLSAPHSLIARLTDIFFGGDGEVGSDAQPLSLTEERTLRRLSMRLADVHLRAVCGPKPAEILALETVRANLRGLEENEPLAIQSFTLTRGKTALGRIEFVHPANRLRDAFSKEEKPSVKDLTAPGWRADLQRALAGVPMTVRSILAEPEMTVGALLGLKPGDTLPIIMADQVPVFVSGTLFALGSIGESNGRAAIRIDQIERQKP